MKATAPQSIAKSAIIPLPGTVSGNIERILSLLPKKRIALICDDTVRELFGMAIQEEFFRSNRECSLFSFPAGEGQKNLDTYHGLVDDLLSFGYGKESIIIGLGGGVVTDLTGFIAATFCRGIPLYLWPTTLLAMVDAAIGGKNGVNTPHGKNMIGTLYQPRAIFLDPLALKTLPASEIRQGLAEMIKHALLTCFDDFVELETAIRSDKDGLQSISLDLIMKSSAIKMKIVAEDPNECGKRHLLNYGHTIAHAIEKLSLFSITHGHALLFGLAVESTYSHLAGLLSETSLLRINDLVLSLLPTLIAEKCFFQFDALWQACSYDKKCKNNIPHIVLLQDIGAPFSSEECWTFPIDPTLLKRAYDKQQSGVQKNS